MKKDFVLHKGDKVVFCPRGHTRVRGAVGEVISCEARGRKGKRKKVAAFIVKWLTKRKGTSTYRIRGRVRRKNNRMIKVSEWTFFRRLDENILDIHGNSICKECPYRLSKVVFGCPSSIKRCLDGTVVEVIFDELQ